MIKELRLKSFGKFRDAAFAFSPVTVFAGDNESGKTTIFDAIFCSACSRPATNSIAGISSATTSTELAAATDPPQRRVQARTNRTLRMAGF